MVNNLPYSSFYSIFFCLAFFITGITSQSQSVIPAFPEKAIKVTEIEGAPTLNIMQRSIILRAEEGSFDTVGIVSNTKWVVKCKDRWLMTNTDSRENTNRIKITARENPGAEARTGKVTVSVAGLPPRIIEVIQKARHEE